MEKIFFAGAGTSGHVEPALAVARWFQEHHPEFEPHFLGTAEGVENTLVPAAGFPLHLIAKVPFPRRPNLAALTWPFRFRRTLRETESLIKGAGLLIGFGGYVAAPAYLAAKRAGIPIIAHEANAKMGLANRLAGRLGGTVLQAFNTAKGPGVGIPLRPSIIELATLPQAARSVAKGDALKSLNLDPTAPTILIFGGSLGSLKFNETVAQSQREISKRGIQIIHAVGGKNELPLAQAGYYPLSYIDDMASAYAAADLVISRSGAVTVVETGTLGIYSAYVPLPIGNGEQSENARYVVLARGGELVANESFTAEWLLSNVDRMIAAAQNYREADKRIDFPLNASNEIGERSLRAIKGARHE